MPANKSSNKPNKALKKPQDFICGQHFNPKCSHNYSSKQRLQDHELTHTGEKPYGCSTCARHFRLKDDCRTHFLRTHNNERPKACSICSKSFHRANGKKRHEDGVCSRRQMSRTLHVQDTIIRSSSACSSSDSSNNTMNIHSMKVTHGLSTVSPCYPTRRHKNVLHNPDFALHPRATSVYTSDNDQDLDGMSFPSHTIDTIMSTIRTSASGFESGKRSKDVSGSYWIDTASLGNGSNVAHDIDLADDNVNFDGPSLFGGLLNNDPAYGFASATGLAPEQEPRLMDEQMLDVQDYASTSDEPPWVPPYQDLMGRRY